MRQERKGIRMAGYVAGIGAANLDVLGRSINSVILRDSNPGMLTMSAGGVTRNVLENISCMGVKTELISAIGMDVFGERIVQSCSAAGIGTDYALRLNGETSSSYIAVLDDNGDMLLGMSDMRILKKLGPDYIRKNEHFIANADAVIIDGCLACETVEEILSVSGSAKVFADPVSTTYARTIARYLNWLYLVKPNLMELEILSGMKVETDEDVVAAADAVLNKGTYSIAVSLGKRGCYYADRSGESFFAAMKPVEKMANATGAGDAFMAGFVYGIVRGADARGSVKYALAAGIAAVMSEKTINENMSEALIKNIIEKYS
jgi:pseudouridine kinase